MPRVIIGAAGSDSGKTTVALGIISALKRRNLVVAASKVGPDFIDAAHLARASGRPARNLDAWLAPPEIVTRSFVRGCSGADIAVVEGVMGLFDGRHGSGDGSTAHVARILAAPVVLVIDCAKASSTVGAIAYGLARFDPRLHIAGAILNRVASDKHAATVSDAVKAAGVPLLGVLRRDQALALSSRHLGLIEPGGELWLATIAAAARAVENGVDLDALCAAARGAPALSVATVAAPAQTPVRIALARDEAFWFYDEAGLEALQDAGAHLVEYAPLRDPFPDVEGAVVGGGYPELHAAALEANVAARAGLRDAIAAGMAVYAECGGLMYLGRELETEHGSHAMVGAVPAISTMSQRRSALRYVEARALADGPLFARGSVVRGHEFHYSQTRYDKHASLYEIEGQREGYGTASLHASYVHVHLGANPNAVANFIGRARAFGGVR